MGNYTESGPVFFVNITKQCNIDCSRCYLTKSSRKDSTTLPITTLAALLVDERFKNKPLTLIWQGGEPSIVGEKLFNDYIDTVSYLNPAAKQGLVTNLFSMPSWLVETIRDKLHGWCETTFALECKTTLDDRHNVYINHFRDNLNKLNHHGISCPVNVELNREMWHLGVDTFVEFILSTKQKTWEFDVSVDFPAFYESPHYENQYPILPQTISNAEMADYLLQLWLRHRDTLADAGVTIDPIHALAEGRTALPFNAGREEEFYTINPDGSVTSNPLFSDIKETYQGTIGQTPLEQIFSHSKGQHRAEYAEKRISTCQECQYLPECRGGPTHIPVQDGSGECVGYRRLRDIFSTQRKVG